MYAKKSLGQHFLTSEGAVAHIVEAGKIVPTDIVLEIGPGKGVLTKKLLATRCSVLAVEKDDELFELLKEKFKNEIEAEQLHLIHDDILNFDFKSYKLAARSYKLIANIPYNITGAILEKFLSSETQPEHMVLLVQKEVAERIVARDKKESILSISVKAYGLPKYIAKVVAGSFSPTPRVDSAIISIEIISKDFFTNFNEKEFFTLLKTGFRSKRKKLSSNLSPLFDKQKVQETFQKLNLDDNTRAEDVEIGKWREIATLLRN